MAIYNDLQKYIPSEYGSCVALGFFDGVHLGHQKVIRDCADRCDDERCVVLTFHESPARALGRACPPLLTDNAQKARIMEQTGANDIIFADFCAVRELSPEEFVQQILHEKLRAKCVCCGFNYHFGHRGTGDTEALKKLCEERGIKVCVCEPVTVDGEQVSSSRIRALITAGEAEKAAKLLGYRFAIEASIDSGNHIGSQMGLPTVNLSLKDGMTVPKFGVYASLVKIDGKVYHGATNIGVHPTVGANPTPLCETFLLNFAGGDLYGKSEKCELVRFVREERHFDSIDLLTQQVLSDCEQIKKMLASEIA